MKNAGSSEKLSSSTGGSSVASRVKSLFSNSPISRRKRAMSLDALSSVTNSAPNPSPARVLGVPLADLVAKDGIPVPFIVKKIVRHVEDFGLDQVGIYRINGNVKVIEKLRESFDKVGDANFKDEDIASVAGLLKLFLRELPDGVVPEILLSHFVSIQQSHPGEATPDTLEAFQKCLHFLPEPNYNVLRYLVRHMAKVAEHSEQNKMTAVSLSIVFGPNLFHCGAGLEGLRLQGVSNSAVCRMIQHHKVLFPRGKKWGGSGDPIKPRPYVEHLAEKKRSKENTRADLSATYDGAASPYRMNRHIAALSELDKTTYSERSIDEAIYERSQGTLSPSSPAHVLDDSRSNSASPIHTSGNLSQMQVLSNVASGGLGNDEPEVWGSQEGQEEEEDDGTGFQRRNAKRGLSYRPVKRTRSSPVHLGNGDGSTLKHPQVASLSNASSRTSDEDHLMPRTMSPASWQSSPGTTPPTSPALTPRGTRIFNNTVGATVKDLLFQPNVDESKVHSAKKDVYGLLLPEGRKHPSPTPNVALVTKVPLRKSTTSESDGVSGGNVEDTGPVYAVVKRRKKNPDGQRNRKSVLHGTSDSSDGGQGVPFNETNVQLISVTSESDMNSQEGGGDPQGGVAVRSRVGKVSDLVKQFDGPPQHGKDNEELEEELGVTGGTDRGEGGRKRLSQNTLEMFEKTGAIMGMGAPKKRIGSTPAASSTTETAPSSTSMPSRSSYITSESSDWLAKDNIVSDSVGNSSTALTHPPGGVAIIQTSTTASDEEVFASPNHSPDCVPVIGPTHKNPLSTTTSDDVFLSSSKHTGNLPRDETDSGMDPGDKNGLQLDTFTRKGPTLEHLTLSRPKGPKSRKPPTRAYQPKTNAISESTPVTSPTRETQGPTLPLKSSPPLPASPRLGRHRRSLRSSRTVALEDADEEGRDITSSFGDSPHHEQSSSRSRTPKSEARGKVASVSTTPPLGSPQGSSPRTSPPSQSREKAHSRLDLVAQSPESKQAVSAVKKGWSEGGTTSEKRKDQVGLEKTTDRATSTKELTHRIRELKSSVREYEAEFVSKYGRKPTNHEKSPIRSKLVELSKLKKTYHELQASHHSEDQLSKTAPAHVGHQGNETPIRHLSSDLPSTILPLESSVTMNLTPSASPAKGATRKTSSTTDVPLVSDGAISSNPPSSLELVLKNILDNLETRRTSARRPKELDLMTEAQLLQEKHCIQKLLLNYERQYGRPQSRSDKDIMRPLYDRYRAVKRACGKSSTRESTREGTRRTQEDSGLNMTETLPTVTLLHSSMTLGANDITKVSDSLLADGGSRMAAKAEPSTPSREERTRQSNHTMREKRSSHRRHSDAHRRLSESYAAPQREPRPGHDVTQPADHRRSVGDLKAKIMSERELQSCSRSELKYQKDLLLRSKADLRKVLKKFEASFAEMYGRTVTKQDRQPMDKEYAQYKAIKGKLRLIEAVLAKTEPRVTI